jgi:hypothetical protein
MVTPKLSGAFTNSLTAVCSVSQGFFRKGDTQRRDYSRRRSAIMNELSIGGTGFTKPFVQTQIRVFRGVHNTDLDF